MASHFCNERIRSIFMSKSRSSPRAPAVACRARVLQVFAFEPVHFGFNTKQLELCFEYMLKEPHGSAVVDRIERWFLSFQRFWHLKGGGNA
jgi:hypothetical protein